MNLKEQIIDLLKKETGLTNILLETPPSEDLGDFSFPCFQLSKKLKKSPFDIAKDLEKIKKPDFISLFQANGPYLNIFVNPSYLAKKILKEVHTKKNLFGSGKKTNKIVLLESPGPNTNKPLHLGHVRNMLLGNSLVNLNKKYGNKTYHVDIINNRGIHICKSMLAYKKYGKNKKPNKKEDHFVGDFYVLFESKLKSNPKLELELNDLLLKWESKDKKTIELWKKMNLWALKGINESYKRYGTKIDKSYYESDYYKIGKELIESGLKRGVFKKDEKDNVIIDLEKQGLGKKVVLRSDGTSIYITQDLALADLRYKDFKMDEMIYIVANEQIYHFNVLFEILKRLEYSFVDKLYHLSYGYVSLPEGRMKSREGKVVDADDLADEMNSLAKKEIKKRNKKISTKDLEKISEQVGMAALKFYILKYNPLKDFTYNHSDSIQFEGETGPYIQYTGVRIKSILKKYKETPNLKIDYNTYRDAAEKRIINLLSEYPEVIKKATETYDPSLLCKYLVSLAKAFNIFYHKCNILKEKEKRDSRALLASCTLKILEDGLSILGISIPSKM